jgi:hypothetical protein
MQEPKWTPQANFKNPARAKISSDAGAGAGAGAKLELDADGAEAK